MYLAHCAVDWSAVSEFSIPCPYSCSLTFNALLASDDIWHRMLIFANTLDLDQDRQNVGFDLDLTRLILL